jgi:tetratricopeptide (TPR) repeat protein
LEEAIGFMRAAAALRPQHPNLHVKLGRLLDKAKRPDQAVAAYRQAFEVGPNNPYAYAELAQALARQGNSDEALAVYVRYVAANPEDGAAQHALGKAYRRAGQWDKAIAAFQEASRLAPHGDLSYPDLAWSLATCPDPKPRDPARAVEWARKAVTAVPWSRDAWTALGVASYRAEDWEGAVAALERANQLAGGHNNGWFFLAMANWKLDRQEEARKWYDQAVQWMEKHAPHQEELGRFRAEAEELLGVNEKKD